MKTPGMRDADIGPDAITMSDAELPSADTGLVDAEAIDADTGAAGRFVNAERAAGVEAILLLVGEGAFRAAIVLAKPGRTQHHAAIQRD